MQIVEEFTAEFQIEFVEVTYTFENVLRLFLHIHVAVKTDFHIDFLSVIFIRCNLFFRFVHRSYERDFLFEKLFALCGSGVYADVFGVDDARLTAAYKRKIVGHLHRADVFDVRFVKLDNLYAFEISRTRIDERCDDSLCIARI